MPNVTVAFDEGVQGWTSEFTFVPDSGLSLNNKYYTFKDGLMWEHNEQLLPRNNFYGIQGETMIQFVFNQNPTTVKNFKNLGYEGEGEWPSSHETNIETGVVTQYVIKEGKRFSWIQGGADQQFEDIDFASNAVQGIGTLGSINGQDMTFDRVPDFISVADVLYRVEDLTPSNPDDNSFTATPELIGVVESVNGNTITIGQSGIPGLIDGVAPVIQTPVAGDFIMYIKDNKQEKSGIIGYYNIVTMTNSDTEKAEIFSVNSNSFITTV